MKKLISILLLILALTVCLVACNNDGNDNEEQDLCMHEWSEWTTKQWRNCTDWEVLTHECQICGESVEKRGDGPIGHSYKYEKLKDCTADTEKKWTCSICNEQGTITNYPYSSHSFYSSNSGVKLEATCTTEGIRETTCNNCECKKTESIPAAHNYVKGCCTKCNNWIINIILPDTPMTVHDFKYNGTIDNSCVISSVSIKEISYSSYSNKYTITFLWSGEKIYDDDGDNYSDSVGFGYKIYDSDGFVVYSSSTHSTSIQVGEKFRDRTFETSYLELDTSKTYTLVISNLA